jgi:hypothetical protein
MILLNLLDGGPSHSEPLVGPFESMLGGTPATNPHHRLPPFPVRCHHLAHSLPLHHVWSRLSSCQ